MDSIKKCCFSNRNIYAYKTLLFYVMKNSTLYIVFCIITGYEPLLYALEKAIMVKNHTAVKSGYVLYCTVCEITYDYTNICSSPDFTYSCILQQEV